MIWFTADWHLGHDNVLAYMKRPFGGMLEQSSYLVARFNSMVKPQDVTYFLGDMLWNKEHRTFLDSLLGSKVYIAGNHDKRFFGDKHLEIRHIHPKDPAVQIYASHYPLRSWPGRGKGAWNLHGHTHGLAPQWDGALDVGIDAHGFKPVSLDEIIEYFKKEVPHGHEVSDSLFG
jgi:calcineurin-like phosphoesterase family protein